MNIHYEFRSKYVALGGALCTLGSGLYTYVITVFPTLGGIIWASIPLFFLGSVILTSGFVQLSFNEYELLSEWNWDLIHKLMMKMESHEEIRILNTFIPNMDRLIPLLRTLYIEQNKIISLKVLLIDFENAPHLVEARFKYRECKPEIASDTIKENIRQFKELKKEVETQWSKSGFGGKVDIQIRLYDHTPIGAYYQIGKKGMELAFLYTKKAGTSGPALYCKNVNSKKWRSFSENFEDSWNSSRPYNLD